MAAPTYYATLEDDRMRGLRESLESEIHARLEIAWIDQRDLFRRAFHEAYLQGIRDGFAQGVAAESERRATDGA